MNGRVKVGAKMTAWATVPRGSVAKAANAMQAKTHITTGAAEALAITLPATVPALICAVAGGGVDELLEVLNR